MRRRSTVADIPRLERGWGLAALLLNLLVPGGIGTIAAGIHARHRPSLVIGILQALLTVAIVGWVWSVAWGLGFYLRSHPRPASP